MDKKRIAELMLKEQSPITGKDLLISIGISFAIMAIMLTLAILFSFLAAIL